MLKVITKKYIIIIISKLGDKFFKNFILFNLCQKPGQEI